MEGGGGGGGKETLVEPEHDLLLVQIKKVIDSSKLTGRGAARIVLRKRKM